ncbi:MAG: uracil-DNA glycosylase [Bacteroidetes bacterium GWF2_41_61]|nr:MAG: uracil-DNA glycosylase [Bacteroidetes bacterium GWE2_40_15]OFY36780.1 MAG: uracil-DNA glycosylase [Bacteroidetes bacterium GWF2_41_61]OFY91372.1 MAG: uracil-DNA glycosylase [Bacteroidetes bacterium RIFOXYA12_FULL_40_10]HBG23857.1 uracil-DNA glycosylase [Rikenellaceae bacterium]HBZ25814.1 uracil-DNA glycosylase [Rikenellaceae bacterium]
MDIAIENSWKSVLKDEFEKEYFIRLTQSIRDEKSSGVTIYPKGPNIFNAFNSTPFDKVKAVILGQDPYHGKGQAHGLSFSVTDGTPLPPSLQNIFKEIESDLGVTPPKSGNLQRWADQGVFLLNAVLTVRAGEAASHSKIGWIEFTDAVIRHLSNERSGIVFMLWGNFAKSKKDLIDSGKHFILEAAHPSPLARGAFFGCRHFSATNNILISQGKEPINW